MKKLILPILLALLVTGCYTPTPEKTIREVCKEQINKVNAVFGQPITEEYAEDHRLDFKYLNANSGWGQFRYVSFKVSAEDGSCVVQ